MSLLSPLTPAHSAAPHPANWRGQSVTEFDGNDGIQWQVVNDGVMGGLSKGNLSPTDSGTMRFDGTLSLDNNGGFSTFRSDEVDLNLSNDLGLLLLVKGDGRTYQARLATDARHRGMEVSFSADFETKAGEWQQVKVPFADFKASFRGTDLPQHTLDPSMIQRVGILLADKKPGPFSIEIDWIRTYGKGQGDYTERTARRTEKPDGPARLIATAAADERLTTFKAALDSAGLTPFFQWDNPLTVFAPSNEAFAKLPAGTLEDLLKPENKDHLTEILSCHVSVGSIEIADALKAGEVKSVRQAAHDVAFSNGSIRVSNARVIDGDVQCVDGVLHVIDTVLLPGSES